MCIRDRDYGDQVITTWTKELYEGAPVRLADAPEETAAETSGEAAPEAEETSAEETTAEAQ